MGGLVIALGSARVSCARSGAVNKRTAKIDARKVDAVKIAAGCVIRFMRHLREVGANFQSARCPDVLKHTHLPPRCRDLGMGGLAKDMTNSAEVLQQQLRKDDADIRTTFNIYGDFVAS